MPKTTIGIDIEEKEFKAVCMERDEGVHRLVSYGIFTFGGDNDKLRKFIKAAGIPRGEVRVNIEDPSLKIRRLDLPKMPKEEIAEAVRWGMRDVIEGDVSDHEFRYVEISPEDLDLQGKQPVMAFALKSGAVSERYALLNDLKVRAPRVIEPNIGALQAIFTDVVGMVRENPQAMIDLEGYYSPFLVMGRKGAVFSRPLNACGEESLFEQIARDMGVDNGTAHEKGRAVIRSGDLEKGPDVRLKNTFVQFYSKIAIEVQRSIDGYALVFGRQKIDRIYVCGRGAYYPGFADYLLKTIGIDVKIFDPFENIDVRDFSPGPFDGTRALFAVACGLAVD
jgi:Tfp pilus assembly PilM family ATPase